MKARITSPCSQNWEEMKIKVNSRHCDHCSKSVMDFTEMRRVEIIAFLLTNSNQSICGRIKKGQVDFHEEEIATAVRSYLRKNPNTNRAFLVLAIGAMFMASCTTDAKYQGPPQVEITPGVDTNAIDHLTSTEIDTVCASDIDTSKPAHPLPDSLEYFIVGEVAIQNPIDTNDIVHEPEYVDLAHQQDANIIYEFVDQFPEFIGGTDSLFAFVNNHFEVPKAALGMSLEGRIYVRFIINRDGSVEQPEIVRGIGRDDLFKSPIEKLFEEMPKWKPGQKDGRTVRCYYHLPLRIKRPEPLEPTQGGVPQ